MKELGDRGFIFLDDAKRPWLCRMWNDAPWLFYWHRQEKHWVSGKRITQSDIWAYPHNLTEKQQNLYRDAHDRWMKEHAPQFIKPVGKGDSDG